MEDGTHTRPALRHIEEFRETLRHYKMSPHAQKVLHDTNFVVLMGLAGGGRNTIISRLAATRNYFYIISDTTRPPKVRDGKLEENGVNYFFREEEDFLADLQKGEFLEAELIHNQQVSGVSIRELSRAQEHSQIAITDMEYGGVHNVALAKPDAFIIGLLPPSYDEWIRRLREREVIHGQEFINRMYTAEKVLLAMLKEPYVKFVVNDNLDHCAEGIRRIVEQHEYTEADHQAGRAIAQDILQHVESTLSKVEG